MPPCVAQPCDPSVHGCGVGDGVGDGVGLAVGVGVGEGVGTAVGDGVGDGVGAEEIIVHSRSRKGPATTDSHSEIAQRVWSRHARSEVAVASTDCHCDCVQVAIAVQCRSL